MARPRILLITGKLAEPALRRLVADPELARAVDAGVVVLPISVIALATTKWIAEHLPADLAGERLLLPGLCPGDLDPVAMRAKAAVERGPKDLRDLPEYLGVRDWPRKLGDEYSIQIIAEINSVQRISADEILRTANSFRADGADAIDLGCNPGATWTGGETIRRMRREGFNVSIDSFDPATVAEAVDAGAQLVLSVNSSNAEAAARWGCEVVAIPDSPTDLESLELTIGILEGSGVRYRIDPILEPIGCGLAASLCRYAETRRRHPNASMMMGIGNLTELTDVDSAGINVLLAGFCQELGVQSVLTTQVINWCRSTIRELAVARRLVHQAITEHAPPKNVTRDLLMLRDGRLLRHGRARLSELASQITDPNFRLFVEDDGIHVINRDMHEVETDPFQLFAQMTTKANIDPSHAFYLGYELALAAIALKLGKNYVQDQGLKWGLLGPESGSHYNENERAESTRPRDPS